MDLRLPQLLAPLPAPVASPNPPHISAVFLSLSHTHKQVHDHKHAGLWVIASTPWWKGCWKLTAPNLPSPEEGLRLREDRVLPQGHTAYLEQGLELSPGLSIAVLCSLCLAPSCLISLQLSPSPRPHHASWEEGAEGNGHVWVQLPIEAPDVSSAHCHLLVCLSAPISSPCRLR